MTPPPPPAIWTVLNFWHKCNALGPSISAVYKTQASVSCQTRKAMLNLGYTVNLCVQRQPLLVRYNILPY